MSLSLLVTGLLSVTSPRLPENGSAAWDAWLESTRTIELTDARSKATLELLNHSYVTAVEPRRGVPSFLWAERFPGARTPADQGLTSKEAARMHLLRFASVYRLSPATVARLIISEVHDLGGSGAVIVGFARDRDGVPFLRDEIDVVMTPKYELVALTGSLATVEPHDAFRLGAPAALSVAAQYLSGTMLDPGAMTLVKQSGGGWAKFSTTAKDVPFRSEPRARKVYFDDGDAVLPAWHLEVETARSLFAMVVSATDGRVLSITSLRSDASHTYRVFADPMSPNRAFDSPVGNAALPHLTGLPDAFTPPILDAGTVTLDHAGISTMDSWLPSGATALSGNNTNTVVGLDNDGGARAVTTTGTETFDYVYAFDRSADAGPAQASAAAVQAFYITNQAHDVFYDLGFDELSRNGQNDNYGRGGLGNDAMLVRVQDPSRRNNASMDTRADGEASIMRLHLFEVPRASTIDVSTAFFPDGGLFAGVPNVVERESGWDVSGALMTVTDTDGGFGGCDPWADAGQYAGSVVLVRPLGCALTDRIEFARDAGAAALVLEGACVATTDQSLIITCIEPDAGQQLHDAVVSGQPITARLQRPAARPAFDVAFDSTVVTHEYMHFVTNRLIGDSMGLLNSPANAMGEGWSDFAGLYLSLRPDETMRAGNDQWQGTFAIGGWSVQGEDFDGTLVPAHYFGVRRYPYSTDRAKNPLTFKHVGLNVPLPAVTVAPRQSIDPNNAEVHNAGEVWGSILWDAQVRLLNAPGATFDGARVAMGRHLVAALKATPVLPTFIEARDAFLSVVFASSPTGDFPLVLNAFAQRGLGVLAQSSDRRSTTNVPLAEDFTGVGGNYRLVSVVADDDDDDCDADGVIDSAESGTLTVTFMNIGSVRMTQTRVQVLSDLVNLQVSPAMLNLPATDPFTTASVTIPVNMTRLMGIQRANLTIRATDSQIILLQNRFETTATLRLNADTIESDTEDFEQDVTDWVATADGFFPWEDGWALKTVMMSQAMAGADMRAQGVSMLTSPPIAVGANPFSVTFAHSFQFENAMNFFDGGRLEISTDGMNFTAVPGSALAPTYTGMLRAGTANPLAGQDAFVGANTMRHDIVASFGTMYANRTVWLRFVIGADATGGANGWNIDDVRVTGAMMPPFTQVVGHRTMCANHPPTVSGTSSINTAEREEVFLVPGSAFDQDQDPLTFTWMQTNGPSVQLIGDFFVAPEVGPAGAVLGFRVTVSDGRGGTDTDDMTVTVRNVNLAPEITNTTGPIEVMGGDRVTFTATAEDPDMDAISFQWMEEGTSSVTLENATTDTVTFTAPNVKVGEQLSFRVVALDGAKASDPVFIGLIVRPKADQCGCTSFNAALGALGLLLLARRRRR
ncbi:MAG: M36 family metallopeptidase [Archangium sp.]|nr:M36 family metallopeptidase [Archangium sp.]